MTIVGPGIADDESIRLLIKTEQGERSMADNGDSTGSNMIWAVAMIIIVAIIAAALFYGGILGGSQKKQVDVDIKVPAR